MANHHAIIKYKIMNMKILGLKKLEKKIIKNGDLVTSYKTYSLGDGLWSIEMMDENKRTVKEFVGRNGTRHGEEADDLYLKMEEWKNKINHSYMEYKAPDGSRGSYNYFKREIDKGRLHGLVVSF